MRPVILLLVLVLAATSGTLARSEPADDGKQHTLVEPTFPVLTGRVVDGAGLLSAAEISELDAKLKAVEDSSSDQVVVVTVSSLQGYSIEDYGLRLGNHWGVGSKELNNGVLLIVAPNERKVRIEVGRGLEATLTDALSKTIIDTSILPRFRTGDFAAGIKSGAEGIARALGGGAASPAVAVTPSVPLPVAAAESAPAKSAWDEVLNQYRRRTDLIPNLDRDREGICPTGKGRSRRVDRGARQRHRGSVTRRHLHRRKRLGGISSCPRPGFKRAGETVCRRQELSRSDLQSRLLLSAVPA